MPRLRLYLLGSPYLERDGAIVALSRAKALALLAYLAVADGPQARDGIGALFWPDADQTRARAALRSALASLRQILDGATLYCDRELITLQCESDFFLDVRLFSALLAQTDCHLHARDAWCTSCDAALSEAVTLYRGDFMAGFSLRDSPGFDGWQAYQAELLRLELAGALERLTWLKFACRDYKAAVRYALFWLEQDPICEAPHRALMQIHARSGNRSAALRQYQQCERILAEELEIEPDSETRALRDAIIEGLLHGDMI